MSKLFILFLISIIFSTIFLSNIVSSVEVNLSIKGQANNLSSYFNVIGDERAILGIDYYDVFSHKTDGEYARFYSDVIGIELSKDVWNVSLVPSRIFNLTFETYPKYNALLNIEWYFQRPDFEAHLTDFGSNSSYSLKYGSSINMKDLSKYSVQFNGIRYFQLNLTYLYPVASLVLNRSSNIEKKITQIENCFNESLCENWNSCQNLELGYNKTLLNEDEYLHLKKDCLFANYSEDICGYQTRKCDFTKMCPQVNWSTQYQTCFYSENPSCFDSIKNCHDDKCEKDIDCGGPCSNECTFTGKRFNIDISLIKKYLIIIFVIAFALAGIFTIILLIRRLVRKRNQALNWYNFN